MGLVPTPNPQPAFGWSTYTSLPLWLVFKCEPRETHIIFYSTKLHGVMLQRIVALRFTAVTTRN
jgi:hypothetical protein